MNTEIEVKFVDVNIDDMRDQLQTIGATCTQSMRTMRRTVLYPVSRDPDAFVRVRDEGDRVTLTYKLFTAHSKA